MSADRPLPTRVCVLTASARGALGVVRIWGPRAVEVADLAFKPAKAQGLAQGPRDRPRFGRVGVGQGDEVVAVIHGDGTAPPEVEFHCHGGPEPIALVLSAVIDRGAERSTPSGWLTRSDDCPITSEAMADLANAPTLRSSEILLEQAGGALRRELVELLELGTSDLASFGRKLKSLIARAEVGTRLVTGWKVAIAGRPNVGKSRLLNALAGYDRAIVDPTPGTTRDVLAVRTAFEGWPVELIDTAGLRAAGDPIEAAGIALASRRQADSDLTLLVLDQSEPLPEDDHRLIERLDAALIVANKADLPEAWTPWSDSIIVVSAEQGDGLDRLSKEIARRLVPQCPPADSGVPFRQSHRDALMAALESSEHGRRDEAVSVLMAAFGLAR